MKHIIKKDPLRSPDRWIEVNTRGFNCLLLMGIRGILCWLIAKQDFFRFNWMVMLLGW